MGHFSGHPISLLLFPDGLVMENDYLCTPVYENLIYFLYQKEIYSTINSVIKKSTIFLPILLSEKTG
jgi:hypothetical protein